MIPRIMRQHGFNSSADGPSALELVDHLYQRRLGDEWKTKIMIGKPGKTIKKQ